jgi:hypothetical protein
MNRSMHRNVSALARAVFDANVFVWTAVSARQKGERGSAPSGGTVGP